VSASKKAGVTMLATDTSLVSGTSQLPDDWHPFPQYSAPVPQCPYWLQHSPCAHPQFCAAAERASPRSRAAQRVSCHGVVVMIRSRCACDADDFRCGLGPSYIELGLTRRIDWIGPELRRAVRCWLGRRLVYACHCSWSSSNDGRDQPMDPFQIFFRRFVIMGNDRASMQRPTAAPLRGGYLADGQCALFAVVLCRSSFSSTP
jgi:hypothetical protein